MNVSTSARRAAVPQAIWRRLPPRARQRLRRGIRRPVWGNLRRVEPMSGSFGFDRGTPVDRYYLRRFLLAESDAIRGVVGEISESTYTEEFGGDRVTQVEVIDIDAGNPQVTLIADLSRVGSLPSAYFDCLVVVQTLQYTEPLVDALRTCIDALAPGGALLLALPGLSAHDSHVPFENDYWRFLPAGVDALLQRVAPTARSVVRGYGNLVAAVAALHGLAAEELSSEELAHHDPGFPVLVCARVEVPRG